MAGTGKRFSSFLALALVLLEGVSLALVVGILYGTLCKNMNQKFYHKLQARQKELSMVLQDRLNLLETRIRVLSLDNSVRVSLMFGVESPLLEHMKKQYPYSNGAMFFVRKRGNPSYTPQLQDIIWSLKPYLEKYGSGERLHVQRFRGLGGGTLWTLLSIPIKRKDERLGTAFAVYDLSKDTRFWQHMRRRPDSRLLIKAEGDMVDLLSGKRVPLKEGSMELTSEGEGPAWIDLSGEESLIPLDDFPGIFYVSPSKPLHEEKEALVRNLAVLCSGIFLLTLFASFMIARRMGEPLAEMAEQAADIAREPAGRFLNVEKIRYAEFRKLSRAFNAVLLSLMAAQEQLKRRARKELASSEERHRRTLEAAPDAITITRVEDGRYLEVNESFTKLTGYSRDEALGKTVLDLDLYEDPADRERLVRALDSGGGLNAFEVQYRKRNGDTMQTLVSARAIRFDEEDCMIAVVTDITEHKRAEREKRQLETKLQRAHKMEAIGTLAGGVAHDLNNILAGIVSYPELLLMDMPEDSPYRKSIFTIQKAGERAATIVQDLLTLARRGVSISEATNLNNVVSDYLKSPEFEKLLSYHPDVRVETDLEENLLNILGSPVHLFKTLMNLVSNAAEAMPRGGRIVVSIENMYMDRPVQGYDDVEEGDYVVLSVSDTGFGISPEDVERIFEPFYTKKVMGRSGTGLGMAVVWGTVKDHNGYIDVQSREGEGTTFVLYFPVTRRDLAEERPGVSNEKLMGQGETILVVDDVEEQRNLASEMLGRLGYSVSTVESGEKAVEVMQNQRVDLVLLDMIMDPGMDGLATYKRILEMHPGQKAVIASGFSETDRVREAQRLGALRYVKKPYLLEEIGKAVRAELDKKELPAGMV
jgi:two-component system, cell cycle sensor histidine kinase and response regulator CckA